MTSRVTKGECKDCNQPFFQTATARTMDVARGLSEPERCPACRRINAEVIRSRGAAYWQAPVETDDAKRCWGKYGLAKLIRRHPVRQELPDHSVDVRLPTWYRANPQHYEKLATEKKMRQNDLWVARKFAAIATAADALVQNLEDPHGTRVSVLVGPTGTGKSTWVPYRILRSKVGEQGRICVTQPRRITLRRAADAEDDATTPGFIARHLLRLPGGIGAGHEIGFQYSGEYEQKDRYTKLFFVTDGTLIPWLETGKVGQFDVVFIDEAHEQNTNMELIFALLRYRLPLFPRLRVVIASATVDVDKFRHYFGNGDPNAVFLAQGEPATPYTIHDRWLEDWGNALPEVAALTGTRDPNDRTSLLPQAVAATVKAICHKQRFSKLAGQGMATEQGDILAFAPTVRAVDSIRDAVDRMSTNERLGLNVLVSHGQMTPDELSSVKRSEAAAEEAAMAGQPTRPRRVIIATNYAETSVTFVNLSYVIDSGLNLDPAWDPKTCSSRYEPQWHSQAGCTQRKGRVGRVRPGECLRLYTRAEYAAFPAQSPPEVTRQPLDRFFLSAKAAGIEDLGRFEWLGRSIPGAVDKALHEHEVSRSQEALRRRNTIDAQGDVTGRGLELANMQASRVELAECLSESDTFACALEVATFLAFIDQNRSPFLRGEAGMISYARWRAGCYDDLEFYLRLFHYWGRKVAELGQAQRNGGYRGDWFKRQLRDWAKSEALNSDFFDKVAKDRQNNLRQFMRRAHTDITERELDLRRLHRVRLVLAKCLPEWVYSRKQEGLFQYSPYSPDCPCKEDVEIDRDSACLGDPELNAFVCVERVKHKDRLFARHVVKVNTQWLTHLKTTGTVGQALLLTHFTKAESAVATTCAQRVTTLPKNNVGAIKAGEHLKQLRVIRFQDSESGEDTRVLLTQHAATGVPVLVTKGTEDRVEIGDVLQAWVTSVDAGNARIVADQQPLIDACRKLSGNADQVLTCTITYVHRESDTNCVTGLALRIRTGVKGWLALNPRNVSYNDRKRIEKMVVGQRLENLCIASVANKKVKTASLEKQIAEITLVPQNVLIGRQQVLVTGQQFQNAVISDFLVKDGQREGMIVEILPGRQGLLHASAISKIRVVSQRVLQSSHEGESVAVRVGSVSQDDGRERVRLEPNWPTRDNIRPGNVFAGYIHGFWPKDDSGFTGRQAVYVELVPGVNGFLHKNQAPSIRFESLVIGDPVTVRVAQVSPDGKIGLEVP